MTTATADDAPSVGQLRARVRHIRKLLERDLEAFPEAIGDAASLLRAKMFESQAALELAVAALQSHPDFWMARPDAAA